MPINALLRVQPRHGIASLRLSDALPRRFGAFCHGRRSRCSAQALAKVLLCGLAAAAQLAPVQAGQIMGRAVLTAPFPLPADAVLDVQLLEMTRPEAPALLRGRSRSTPSGPSPYAFVVPYVEGSLQPGVRQLLRATIHQAGRVLFSTDAAVAVNEPGQAATLTLRPLGDAPLRGLQWLRAPAASVPAPVEAPRQEQQLRLDPITSELTGSGDCNRFIGTYALEGDRLRLDLTAGTALDCEPAVLADEQNFVMSLRQVRRWQLDPQGRLQLLDETGSPLLLMETRPR